MPYTTEILESSTVNIMDYQIKPYLFSVYINDVGKLCDFRNGSFVFTARCTLVQSAVLRSHVVCLSVCLSVTLVNC